MHKCGIDNEFEIKDLIDKMDAGNKSAGKSIINFVWKKNEIRENLCRIIDNAGCKDFYSGIDLIESEINNKRQLYCDGSGIIYGQALEYEKRGDVKESILLFYAAALCGSKKAEYTLSNMGGVESEYFFSRFPSLNDIEDSDNFVGEKTDNDELGILKDKAERGDIRACYELGVLYQKGENIEKSQGRAFFYFYKAATLGDKDAQYEMGNYFGKGEFVERDYEEAAKWYTMSAEQGHFIAQYNLGLYYENRRESEGDYKEAVKWYEKSAEQGYNEAQKKLGDFYETGLGVEQDYKKAVKCYDKSAKNGNVEAQKKLGFCYYNGKGVGQNYEEAVKWFKKAAEKGDAEVEKIIGDCYKQGKGVEIDKKESVKWYRKAADNGNKEAKSELEFCNNEGEHCDETEKQNKTECLSGPGDLDVQNRAPTQGQMGEDLEDALTFVDADPLPETGRIVSDSSVEEDYGSFQGTVVKKKKRIVPIAVTLAAVGAGIAIAAGALAGGGEKEKKGGSVAAVSETESTEITTTTLETHPLEDSKKKTEAATTTATAAATTEVSETAVQTEGADDGYFRSEPVTTMDGYAVVEVVGVSRKNSTVDVKYTNNSNTDIKPFDNPNIVVNGNSIGLNSFSNMHKTKDYISPDSSKVISYNVDSSFFESGGRIVGTMWGDGYFKEKSYDLNVEI